MVRKSANEHLSSERQLLNKRLVEQALAGNEEAVSALKAEGASFEDLLPMGFTPLSHYAVFGTTEDCRKLVDAGADINFGASDSNSPAHNVVRFSDREGACESIENLSRLGADFNLQSRSCFKGETVLHTAARVGSEPIVRALLKAGADPVIENAMGETPADVARFGDCPEIFELLSVDNKLSKTKRNEARSTGKAQEIPCVRKGKLRKAEPAKDGNGDDLASMGVCL